VKLVEAGEQLRSFATERTKKETAEEKEHRVSSRKRKRDTFDSDDGWNDMVCEQLIIKREQDERTFKLREAELKLMQDKFEDDRKEREAARKQSDKQLELISAIINKLK